MDGPICCFSAARWQMPGIAKRLDLETYPLMSLKQAREGTQRLRASLEQGPIRRSHPTTGEAGILKAESIEALFRQWYEVYCKKNKKGHKEILRSFEIYVFPKIGELPAEKVTLHEWLALLEEQAKVTPGIADRLLTNAKQVLKWGVKRRLLPVNPLCEIDAKEDRQIKKIAGPGSLSPNEIKMA